MRGSPLSFAFSTLVLSANIRHWDLYITFETGVIDGIQDVGRYALDSGPTRGGPARGAKDNDGDAAIGEILLIFQVGVRCHQNLETTGVP